MATKAHKLLTGTDLHEPKGVASVPAGQVYVSDGGGSGVWTTINTTIDFSTGDIKPTLKNVADTGWLLFDDTSIGNTSSTATHKGPQYQALFNLIWNNISSSFITVSPTRGGSSTADWAANKAIFLPSTLGRVLAVAGTGSGLSVRTIGQLVGEETHLLNVGEMPSHFHSASISDPGHNHSVTTAISSYNSPGGATTVVQSLTGTVTGTSTTGVRITSANGTDNTSSNGGNFAHNNMQPTVFVNMMVKL